MARPIRVEYEGAVYHVTARGNERQRIFRSEEDHILFLTSLEQCVEQHGLRVHGYCLMPNHYHLLIETPRGNLSRAIGWLQTTYTIRFNRKHRRSGHLFQGRFKAHLVEADAYAMTLLRYVHLNPVRSRNKSVPVSAERRGFLSEYKWSSHRYYLGSTKPPGWLCLDWLSFFGQSRQRAQREYRRFIEEAFEAGMESPWGELKSGLVLGGDALLERAWGILGKKRGAEELAWTMRVERSGQRAITAQAVAGRESDARWKVWVLARHGNLRGIDIARQLGYKDGSAITHMLKRVEATIHASSIAAQHASALESKFNENLSRFKS